jgi:hypothetical protein
MLTSAAHRLKPETFGKATLGTAQEFDMRAGMYGRRALPGIAGVRYTGAATSSSRYLHPKNCRHYADSFEDQTTGV